MQFTIHNYSSNITKVEYYSIRANGEEYLVDTESDITKLVTYGSDYRSLSCMVDYMFYSPDEIYNSRSSGENKTKVENIIIESKNYLFIKIPAGIRTVKLYSKSILAVEANFEDENGVATSSLDTKNGYMYDRVLLIEFSYNSDTPNLVEVHEAFGHKRHKISHTVYYVDSREVFSKLSFDAIINTIDLEFRTNCLISDDFSKFYVGNKIVPPELDTMKISAYNYVYTGTGKTWTTIIDWVNSQPYLEGLSEYTLSVENGSDLDGQYILSGSPGNFPRSRPASITDESEHLFYLQADARKKGTTESKKLIDSSQSGIITLTDGEGFLYADPIYGTLYSYTSPKIAGGTNIRTYYLKNSLIDAELGDSSRQIVNNPSTGDNSIYNYINEKYDESLDSTDITETQNKYVLSAPNQSGRSLLSMFVDSSAEGMELATGDTWKAKYNYDEPFTDIGDKILYPNDIHDFNF